MGIPHGLLKEGITRDSDNIKRILHKEDSVCIMLRAIHFVLLFAVFICAYAAPAAEGPAIAPDIGFSEEQPVRGPVANVGQDQSDLDTDATHWGYVGYYKPRWGYYNDGWGWGGRGYGWGGGWGGRGYGWGGWKSHYWY